MRLEQRGGKAAQVQVERLFRVAQLQERPRADAAPDLAAPGIRSEELLDGDDERVVLLDGRGRNRHDYLGERRILRVEAEAAQDSVVERDGQKGAAAVEVRGVPHEEVERAAGKHLPSGWQRERGGARIGCPAQLELRRDLQVLSELETNEARRPGRKRAGGGRRRMQEERREQCRDEGELHRARNGWNGSGRFW